MSFVNKRILDAIENSDLEQDLKSFLKTLLMIELKNLGDKRPRYSEDYDRVIKRYVENRGKEEDE